jgi:hypothetical protein
MKLVTCNKLRSILVLIVVLTFVDKNLCGQSTFQYSYDQGFGTDVISLSDNNLLILEVLRNDYECSKIYSTEEYSFRLLKLDTVGGIIWRTNKINSGLSSCNPIYAFESNNVGIDIFIDSWLCPPQSMFNLFKLNDSGNLNYSIEIPFTLSGGATTPYYENIEFISRENDNYLILSENTLVSMNNNGDTLSSYMPSLGIEEKIRSWKLLPNGNKLFLCGNSCLINYSELEQKVIWKRSIGEYDFILDYQISNDGNVLISGTAKDTIINSTVYSNASLTRLDINGDTLSHKVFPNTHSQRFLEVLQLNDSLYVSVQSSDIFKMVFLDKNFEYRLVKDLINLKSFNSLKVISNSIYILGSTNDSWITSNEQKVLLIKTNTTGEIADLQSITKIDQVSSAQINFYPNPTNGLINIESSLDVKEVELYSSLGKLVYFKDCLNQKELTIDLNIVSGLYIMKICYSDNTYSTSLIHLVK